MVSATPLVSIGGILVGWFVKEKPVFYGFVTVISFFLCETIYLSILSNRFGFYHHNITIWFTLLSIISWVVFFVLMTKIGVTICQKHEKVQQRELINSRVGKPYDQTNHSG